MAKLSPQKSFASLMLFGEPRIRVARQAYAEANFSTNKNHSVESSGLNAPPSKGGEPMTERKGRSRYPACESAPYSRSRSKSVLAALFSLAVVSFNVPFLKTRYLFVLFCHILLLFCPCGVIRSCCKVFSVEKKLRFRPLISAFFVPLI